MLKKRFVIKNAVKLFAAVIFAALIIFTTASCATLGGSPKQTVITIIGIDSQYNDMFAIAGLSSAGGATVAAGFPRKIASGRVICEMFEINRKEASVKGTYSVIIRISEGSEMNAQTVFIFNGVAALQKIDRGKNTIAFDKFIRVD